MSRLDWTIVRTAATGGLLILVPGALGAGLLVDDGSSAAWAWPFAVIILIGFGVAGYVAGRLRPDTPMLHGAVGAFLAYLVAQVLAAVAGLVDGGGLNWAAASLTALLAVTLGVAGALLSDVVHRHRLRRAGR